MKEVKQVYDVIAESWDERRKEPWPEVTEFLKERKAELILDAGCGTGRQSRKASETNRVVCMDFSKNMLALARKHNSRAHYVVGSVTHLPFKSGVFDSGICVAVIHHLKKESERVTALSELGRVLRIKGEFFVSVWKRDQPRFKKIINGGDDVMMQWTVNDVKHYRYYHLFTLKELLSVAREAGIKAKSFKGSKPNELIRNIYVIISK